MKLDFATEVLMEDERAALKRFEFEHERIEHMGGEHIEHSWTVVMLGRRFLLSVGRDRRDAR